MLTLIERIEAIEQARGWMAVAGEGLDLGTWTELWAIVRGGVLSCNHAEREIQRTMRREVELSYSNNPPCVEPQQGELFG